ncbi:hypothetical protein [Tissierella creatinophila]|uniref:Uncharacterized protein n=1 Tax=Tissierella creatinophila DSM 6911 TaxID=1123403 RepID=A0A1U7M5G8_TISCR|nr:hypothetical protein [Tissierella creatinophila]OLS02525.1 hypothetical protein TICRE_14810 [Tissierella creatinophila DSM 6911]
MEMNTNEIIKKKILDSQEMVRDYKAYSGKVKDTEVADLFKTLSEECGYQAKKLQDILKERL